MTGTTQRDLLGPQAQTRGLLVVSADDWGLDEETTKRILSCIAAGRVTSVSAMVFMADSTNAAAAARAAKVDAGLHINLTTAFTAATCPAALRERQMRLVRYLRTHRWSRALFHPLLVTTFEYVVKAQYEEFQRLYGSAPTRLDGHHHMHLCANVLVQHLLPSGTRVRRNLSFASGEKGLMNRWYRRWIDGRLGRHHRLTDLLFALGALRASGRVEWAVQLASHRVVEIETHPGEYDEYECMMGEEFGEWLGQAPLVSFATM